MGNVGFVRTSAIWVVSSTGVYSSGTVQCFNHCSIRFEVMKIKNTEKRMSLWAEIFDGIEIQVLKDYITLKTCNARNMLWRERE